MTKLTAEYFMIPKNKWWAFLGGAVGVLIAALAISWSAAKEAAGSEINKVVVQQEIADHKAAIKTDRERADIDSKKIHDYLTDIAVVEKRFKDFGDRIDKEEKDREEADRLESGERASAIASEQRVRAQADVEEARVRTEAVKQWDNKLTELSSNVIHYDANIRLVKDVGTVAGTNSRIVAAVSATSGEHKRGEPLSSVILTDIINDEPSQHWSIRH